MKHLLNIIIFLCINLQSTYAALADSEDCIEEIKTLMSQPSHVASMQKLLTLQGKLTLHRLAWATTQEENGTKDFKLENKIDSLLNDMKSNKDPNFQNAVKIYKNNKLSRTGLARIMPFVKDILNEQNKIKDSKQRNLYILQDSDLKLLSILAENEEKRGDATFNDILYRDTSSQKSVLNFTKVINSSMRQRAVSKNTKNAITKQLKEITKKIEKVIASLPLSEPCKSSLLNQCSPDIQENFTSNIFTLIKDFKEFDKQESLKYDDFWLHVGKKVSYVKSEEFAQKQDFSIPQEVIIKPKNEQLYFNKLADFVLDKYPYFTSRETLLADPELLLALTEAIDKKEEIFIYNNKEYFLPNNYNPAKFAQKGKVLYDNAYSIAITPMDRKLNLPHVQMIDKQRADFVKLKKLIPQTIDDEEQREEFFHTMIAANFSSPPQITFDFKGALFNSKTGQRLATNKEALLSFPKGSTQKTSALTRFQDMDEEHKALLYEQALSPSKSHIYKNELFSISNTKLDTDSFLSKRAALNQKIKNNEDANTDESKRNIVQAIIEGRKTTQIGSNIFSPLSLEVFPYKKQEKLLLNFQKSNNITPTNPLSLNHQTRKDWFQAVMNNNTTFTSNNIQYNTLNAKAITNEISSTNNKLIDYNKYKDLEEKLNSLDDKALVIEFNKKFPNESGCQYYTIIDKKNNELTVYNKKGEQIFNKEVLSGQIKSDKRTQFLLTKEGSANKKTTNRTTAAGIFYSHNFKDNLSHQYYQIYENNLLALVTEKGAFQGPLNDAGDYETVLAIHQVPINMENRYSMFNNQRDEDNRLTNGCINLTKEDFIEYHDKFPAKGCPIYILPEEVGNRMKVKDSKIIFTPKDRSKCSNEKTCNPDYYFSPTKTDKSSEIDIVIMNPSRAKNPLVKSFTTTLEKHKKELSQKLGLTSDEYNDLAHLSYAIFGVESDFGTGGRYKIKEGQFLAQPNETSTTINKDSSSLLEMTRNWIKENLSQDIGQAVVTSAKVIKGKSSQNSRGLTQIKNILAYTKKYYPHINEDNLTKPENAALATVIVLNEMKNKLKRISHEHNNIDADNRLQFLYYIYNGSTSQIKNGNATPDLNIKTRKLQGFLDEAKIYQEM